MCDPIELLFYLFVISNMFILKGNVTAEIPAHLYATKILYIVYGILEIERLPAIVLDVACSCRNTNQH